MPPGTFEGDAAKRGSGANWGPRLAVCVRPSPQSGDEAIHGDRPLGRNLKRATCPSRSRAAASARTRAGRAPGVSWRKSGVSSSTSSGSSSAAGGAALLERLVGGDLVGLLVEPRVLLVGGAVGRRLGRRLLLGRVLVERRRGLSLLGGGGRRRRLFAPRAGRTRCAARGRAPPVPGARRPPDWLRACA